MLKKITSYFNKTELLLWGFSVTTIIASYILFSSASPLSLTASLIGVTSLIFCAKGNPFGQVLMIIFSIIYTIISYSFSYYGEMITYFCMTLPMAVFSLISWLRHPFKGNKSRVEVNRIRGKEIVLLIFLTCAVTIAFYFILKKLGTANLIVSTLSVATSFAAAYLTFRRDPFLSLLYSLNDIVLIALWIYAAISDRSYISVAVCFTVFLINDIYCFISLRKMEKQQTAD
ncbi:MAG: nicotinamide mononucleotide transporter [Clostridia bacterium]|nr:nicotinamide mononucleotide transporter [Clostridia bacterium]